MVIYDPAEVGPARWTHDNLSSDSHFISEILIYGTVGPILAFALLEFFARWLEEREATELQAQVLKPVREQARVNHKLSDDALQALFAASALIVSLESRLPDNSPEAAAQLREAQKALDHIIQELRAHLLAEPPTEK
jgi:signal transduction histidine kinase